MFSFKKKYFSRLQGLNGEDETLMREVTSDSELVPVHRGRVVVELCQIVL